jgi:hypothetical protein
MKNLHIWQENDTATSLLSTNAQVADILGCQEVLWVITADLLENTAPN